MGSPEAKPATETVVSENLRYFLEENKEIANALVRRSSRLHKLEMLQEKRVQIFVMEKGKIVRKEFYLESWHRLKVKMQEEKNYI